MFYIVVVVVGVGVVVDISIALIIDIIIIITTIVVVVIVVDVCRQSVVVVWQRYIANGTARRARRTSSGSWSSRVAGRGGRSTRRCVGGRFVGGVGGIVLQHFCQINGQSFMNVVEQRA